MKSLVATPFIPISKYLHSHRAAQGVIYADQLKQAGLDVTCNMSQDLYHEDFNQFDQLFVYHGNDWHGGLNLFGGLQEFPYIQNFVNFTQFKGKVYSLVIPFPDYHEQLKHKVDLCREKQKKWNPLWDGVNWDNLKRMQDTSETVDPNLMVLYDKVVAGDSHAICMYRPGWMMNSVPFKTLHGAINTRLGFYARIQDTLPPEHKLNEIEFYFGNIDIRHHLMRQEDPDAATKKLVEDYFRAAQEVAEREYAEVSIYEPLPIENPSRTIPKTGWYAGAPFHGTWEERTAIRSLFIQEATSWSKSTGVHFIRWTSHLYNTQGELDFKKMELPQSIHLSRAAYPHWQGWEWNRLELPDALF